MRSNCWTLVNGNFDTYQNKAIPSGKILIEKNGVLVGEFLSETGRINISDIVEKDSTSFYVAGNFINPLGGSSLMRIILPVNADSSCNQEENTDEKTFCDNIIFISGNTQIKLEGLVTAYSKVEIIGRNTDWQVIPICDGDCSTTQIIPDLANGEYTIKVIMGDNDGTYCYREKKLAVFKEEPNSVNCDELDFVSENGQVSVSGLVTAYSKVEIIGKNTDWQVIPICDGDCFATQIIPDLANGEYTIKVIMGNNDGTYWYREKKLAVFKEEPNSVNCDELDFVSENGQVSVSGLVTAYSKVEIIGKNTDWQVIPICDGDCSTTQIIPNLADGEYAVKVNQGGTQTPSLSLSPTAVPTQLQSASYTSFSVQTSSSSQEAPIIQPSPGLPTILKSKLKSELLELRW